MTTAIDRDIENLLFELLYNDYTLIFLKVTVLIRLTSSISLLRYKDNLTTMKIKTFYDTSCRNRN